MNRRGFLRAVGAAAVAAPLPASASLGCAEEAAIALGGGAEMAGASGLVAAGANAPTLAPVGVWHGLAWDALRDIRDKEWARLRWWFVHRKHRLAVRRGKEEPMSARVIWLRMKLKDARRKANPNGECTKPDDGTVLPRRFRYKKRDARERAAYRARGFFKMPWEL